MCIEKCRWAIQLALDVDGIWYVGGMPKELIRFIVKMMRRLETCHFFLDDRD